MSVKELKKKSEGFTIIEVLIVLAIAGLILLIVFLAVPALQRNSRNTQARNEAANILGAVSEYSSNNNGKLPASADAATVLTSSNVKTITSLTIEATAGTTVPSSTVAVLKLASKCNTTNNGVVAGAGRQVALLYTVEDNSGNITTCTSS